MPYFYTRKPLRNWRDSKKISEPESKKNRDLKNNPESIGKALKPSDFWSLRIGDYRAIFEIDRAKKQVIVLFIGHGKKVYDDFSKML